MKLEEGMFNALLVASRVNGKALSTTSFMFLWKEKGDEASLELKRCSGGCNMERRAKEKPFYLFSENEKAMS